MANVQKIEIDKLILDKENPRLAEFGISAKSSDNEILEILWEEMAIDELMYSIVSNTFWDYEPLIVLKSDKKFIVVEGNRRLAAVKLIQGEYEGDKINIPEHIQEKIDDKLLTQTITLPCIVISSREEAWRFIGFKHVNGPAKWGSFAKAKYIAEVHNNFHVDIETIAYQIGDTNKTAIKLYQGLMVLEQAKRAKVYDYEVDKQNKRLFFSHLYTGLQREGIRDFLKISDAAEMQGAPVPKAKLEDLGQLLEWLFGSRKNDTQPLIRSQNPDLKYLDQVLQERQAIAALKAGESLEYAFELSRPSGSLFEESLLSAKRNIQKARAHLTTGYNGEEDLLKVAGSTAELADDLYNEMFRVNEVKAVRPKKKRITE